MKRRISIIALLTSLLVSYLPAQSLDRSLVPPAGKPPEFHVPAWTKQTLPNGAMLIVCERHELPLISFSITFIGGADQLDPPKLRGLATMAVGMLNEGTTSKTGDQFADALQLLGTRIEFSMASESGAMRFVSTKSKFEPVMALLADVLLNPSYPADALERQRAQGLIQLSLAKNRPESIAGRVFPTVLYGTAHPFGRQISEESLKAITRDDMVALHKAYYRPNRAIITVVGDIDAPTIKASLDRNLSGWTSGGEKPSFDYPALPANKPTTIYLIDKPGAAQSIVSIGLPGPPRKTPDYFPLAVLNRILGGHFQSRLNHNIREVHGYSYGVNSSFAYGHGPGPFRAGGAIVSEKTDAALKEFMREFRGVLGERPITDEELKTAKEGMIQQLPNAFSSVSGIGNALTDLQLNELPDDYFETYPKSVSAVTKEDLARVAKQYIDIDHLAIVVVGDRRSIEGPLKATAIASIVHLDGDGNPN